ncbi:hypothetical protein BAC1_01587 [uncultured bacterium]|nr:hypothetical protein BAC1_01587 [uncultured bacterium]
MSETPYTTMDAYQAAYLVIHGHAPELLHEGPKVIFAFKSTPTLFKDISDYQSGSRVEALRLANTIKILKSQIFAKKKNVAGEWYGRGKAPSF